MPALLPPSVHLYAAVRVPAVVTDRIPLRPGTPDNIRVLSCAHLPADSIRRIFTADSVSEVFRGESQLF